MTTPTLRGRNVPTELVTAALERLPTADVVAVSAHIARIRECVGEFVPQGAKKVPAPLRPFAAAAVEPLLAEMAETASGRLVVLGPLGRPWAAAVAAMEALRLRLQDRPEDSDAALDRGWSFLHEGNA